MTRTRLLSAGVMIHQEMSDEDKLKMHVAETGISIRTSNSLERNNITSVHDLLERTEEELLSIPNFGNKTLNEVFRVLANLGFPKKRDKKPHIKKPHIFKGKKNAS